MGSPLPIGGAGLAYVGELILNDNDYQDQIIYFWRALARIGFYGAFKELEKYSGVLIFWPGFTWVNLSEAVRHHNLAPKSKVPVSKENP